MKGRQQFRRPPRPRAATAPLEAAPSWPGGPRRRDDGAADRSVWGRLRGLLATPEEGWATLLALTVMMLVAAFAIDEAVWAGYVLGTKLTQTSFLPLAVVVGTLVGFVLARSSLGTLRAHVIGSTIGAGFLLFAISGAVSRSPALEERLRALSESVARFVGDVFGLGIRSAETSIFLLLIGGLLWAAAQLGAFALFRRHRPGPAVGLAGTALLINMSITVRDQLPHLVVFVAAALLLLVRTSLIGQLEQWRSRRIADSGAAGQLFLRSGAMFIALAIVSSLVLATNASSAPLRPMWDQALERLVEVGIEVNRLIGGVSGPARGPSLLFTPTQTLREQWETSNERVFTAITADGRAYKWRGSTYDLFDGRSWQHQVAANIQVGPFQDIQAVTADRGLTAGRHEVLSEITSVNLAGNVIVAPADPILLDQAATVETAADGGLLRIKIGQSLAEGSSYVVISRVFDRVGTSQLTEAELAAAGRRYGSDMERYTAIQPGSVGPVTTSVANGIVESLAPGQRNPYHIAKAIQDYLYRGGGFEYDTDVTGMCSGENVVDCFLREKRGYCEYFATTMTMMLRTQKIPARYVVGYLPGRPEQFEEIDENGLPITLTRRVIERSASHAWVEVFFPGYGWIPFDPTPGLTDFGQEPTEFPSGAPLVTQRPDDAPETPFFGPTPDEGNDLPLPPPVTPRDTSGPPPIVALLLGMTVLAAALLLVVFARRRRLPGSGQLTYDSVARIATRMGYGPLPSQTAYEYADRLAVVVPAVRTELQVVADAKVEAVYARREPSEELRIRLLYAYRRVRLSLLGLLLRRPRWLGGRAGDAPPTS